MDAEKGEPEIKVTDRRRFSSEGEPLDAAEESAAEAEEVPGLDAPPPPATFEVLVLTLRLQAEFGMGQIPGRREQQPPDLAGARHAID
ncbi:MAG: hypothetical protein ACREE7_16445, partial [Dongiaceae bacterium]